MSLSTDVTAPQTSRYDGLELELIQKIVDENGLDREIKIVDSIVFLDGSRIQTEKWAGLVRQIHKHLVKPNRVVLFAHLFNRPWADVNAFRTQVVDSGGLLLDMRDIPFETAIERYMERISDRVNSYPIPTRINVETEQRPAAWDDYLD